MLSDKSTTIFTAIRNPIVPRFNLKCFACYLGSVRAHGTYTSICLWLCSHELHKTVCSESCGQLHKRADLTSSVLNLFPYLLLNCWSIQGLPLMTSKLPKAPQLGNLFFLSPVLKFRSNHTPEDIIIATESNTFPGISPKWSFTQNYYLAERYRYHCMTMLQDGGYSPSALQNGTVSFWTSRWHCAHLENESSPEFKSQILKLERLWGRF